MAVKLILDDKEYKTRIKGRGKIVIATEPLFYCDANIMPRYFHKAVYVDGMPWGLFEHFHTSGKPLRELDGLSLPSPLLGYLQVRKGELFLFGKRIKEHTRV